MVGMKTIRVVRDFGARPFGRTQADGDLCGANFRERCLAPRLRAAQRVHVDLTGYNRYGRSFLDEAFGGLIRAEGFTAEELRGSLSYSHDLLPSLEQVIGMLIDEAEQGCYGLQSQLIKEGA